MAFDVTNTATWPVVLTVEHISAIYGGRSVLGIKKACQQHKFLPAPYRTRPYLWRRAAVLRDVEGARGFQQARSA